MPVRIFRFGTLTMSFLSRVIQRWRRDSFSEFIVHVGSFVRNRVRQSIQNIVVPQTGIGAQRDKFDEITSLLKTDHPIIIDGGAHDGETIQAFRRVFESPTIIAYEPNPYLARQLRGQYEGTSNVDIRNVALANEHGERTLHVTKDDVASSMFTPTLENKEAFGEGVGISQDVSVTTVRLDDEFSSPPDIVKLDLQGAEFDALTGAEGILSNVNIILVEVGFRELYDGQHLFFEVHNLLEKHGFTLHNLYDQFIREDGVLVESDALYLKN